MYGDRAGMYADHLAATSPQCDVVRNIELANVAFGRTIRNRPVGDDWLPCHASNLHRLRRGEPLSGFKVSEFARALRGDFGAIVIDTWMLRATGMAEADIGSGRVNSAFRTAHEAVRQLAEEHGHAPSAVQAAVWCAYRSANATRDVGAVYFEFTTTTERTAA